ncbi:hypothetical protein Rsub_09975 [Raphidocelis subcapitata]|uniref:Rhodanese domain-containing protein n=1 Tax=Raphidocelis subcapitata TaxID=307507 RepID=A0A2V0PBP8_9CHLO|nr:hypothetical protein Rsub_09975 [Raphidocelis subcapitata]|eukprot:GBF97284.1 hypothetical protein Rsub_09975 [Raphidocelis subcapitata]
MAAAAATPATAACAAGPSAAAVPPRALAAARRAAVRGAPPAAAVPAAAAAESARRVVVARATEAGQQEALWESQVRDGRVRSVDTRGAGHLMKEGWVLLDVRPPTEVEKVSIDGAVAVPLFVPETRSDLASLLKRASTWGTGGWWLGGTHMNPNPDFMEEVLERVPLDARVIVGCQRGLRSLAACEQLSRAGYGTLAWVNGGFDTAETGDLPTLPDGRDIRFAGIGGVSEMMGWTEVQQQYSKGFMGGSETVFKLVGIFLAVDLLLIGIDYINSVKQGTPFVF